MARSCSPKILMSPMDLLRATAELYPKDMILALGRKRKDRQQNTQPVA